MLMEPTDDQRAQGIQRAGCFNNLHKDHGGTDDQHGIYVGEGSLYKVPDGEALIVCQRPGHCGEHHCDTGRQLEKETTQHEHANHDQEDDEL